MFSIPAIDDRFPQSTAHALQGSQPGESNFSDGSGALFTMYLDLAEEEDKTMVESWKGNAEGLHVFVGLRPTSHTSAYDVENADRSVLCCRRSVARGDHPRYSAELAGHLSILSRNHFSATCPVGWHPNFHPVPLSNPTVSFTAPTWAVWVNALWFMSLVISITCALLATLLQQWARHYLIVAHPRSRPHMRARIRAFYRKGIEELHLPWVVEGLPALLHISLFLLFAGLSVFLFSVNYTIFKAVILWIALCVIAYAYLTVSPIRHKNSPYSVPLSAFVLVCLTGIRSGVSQFIERFPRLVQHFVMHLPNRNLARLHPHNFFSHSMTKTAEQFVRQLGSEIGFESLMWTFDSLDEDRELEQFFEGVPGLCGSKEVPNAQLGVIKRHEKKFSSALIEFMNRTLSSNLISESIKRRRIDICTRVVDVTSLLGPWWILRHVLLGNWQKFLGCIEFGLFVINWKAITHAVTLFYAECVAAVTISSVPKHDDRWLQLASGPLDASKWYLLHNHSTNYDNILLANTISIVRRTIQTYSGSPDRHRSDILGASTKTLESLRKLDINQILPELQYEFCSVWNQLVDLAKNDQREYIVYVAKTTLKNIRKLYLVSHKGTSAYPTAFSGATDDGDSILDDPNSYCTCSLAGHGPCKNVPELKIEEPAQEVTEGGLPMPIIRARTNPASQSHSIFSPTSSPAPVPQLQTTAQASSFSQPTHSSASQLEPQAHFVRPTPPTSPFPRAPTPLPLPQVPPMAHLIPRKPDVGAK